MNVTVEEQAVTGGPDPATIIAQAISPYPDHHDGYRRRFAKILAGADCTVVPEGHVGCAMAAVAYIRLAQCCVPAGGPAQLIGMSLRQWLAECPG